MGVILLHRFIEQGDRVPSNLPIDGHSFRRVEVLSGTPRRRRWRDAEKAAIVAESLALGAKTSEIALRYGLHRNQLCDWRRQFRSAAVADAGLVTSDFVPVVAENRGGSGAAAIEIEIGGATLRVGAEVELAPPDSPAAADAVWPALREARTDWTTAARLSAPRRKSTGRVEGAAHRPT